MTLFSNNIWQLPYMINKGDLDYHIVRPVHSYFMACFRDVAVNSFVNLVIAGAFLIWALVNYPEPLGAGRIVLSLSMLIMGSFLFQFLRMLFVLPVFWTQSGRGLDTLFWSMQKFMERPYGIYVGAARLIFLTVLPFALMASVPADILFAQNPWPLVGLCIVVTAVFIFLNLKVWNWGIRSYSSASS